MKRILIVEDDALLNKTLTYNLISDGHHVTSASNTKTAANILSGTEYDLVLLDIRLPDGSGYDLCRLIKLEHPDTLVIFLTANDQESDQLRGYEMGAVDYITKPFSVGVLQRKRCRRMPRRRWQTQGSYGKCSKMAYMRYAFLQ